MKHLGDITKIDWYSVEPVDVVTGGSPCQDLSVAGKRAGLAGERSGLYMEQIRCVKELREADVLRGRTGQFVRPRYMVWENVPGAFSSGNPKGSDFAAVIEEIIKVAEPNAVVCVMPPSGGWTKSGCYYDSDGKWSIAWRVHDAQFWGATYYNDAGVPAKHGTPQRRKRIALVADFGGLSAPEILFERKGLSGHFEQSGAPREGAAAAVGDGAAGAKCYGIGGYNSEGMKSPNPHSGIYEAETSRTLDLNGGSPACNQGGIAVVDTYQTVTGPLMANSHPGSYCGQDAYSDMLVAGCFQNTGQGWWNESDVGATLRTPCGGDATKANLVIAGLDCRNGRENGDLCGTLQSKPNGGFSYNCIHPVRCNNIVRRLTPLECGRLQGYPDGWTDIGKWVDSKGKRHKEADSPRYKALGNSIALPFWCWLAKRISAQYERDITIGSLFDGIGGFPYAFEKCGGKALWASEIEEFPIAVTKIRFPEED